MAASTVYKQAARSASKEPQQHKNNHLLLVNSTSGKVVNKKLDVSPQFCGGTATQLNKDGFFHSKTINSR